MRIDEALSQLRAAAEQLAAEHPDLAADERAFVDTLDGMTDGLDLAEYLAERVLHLEAMTKAAEARAEALMARGKRFDAEGDRLRGIILALVEAAGGKKVVRPTMTLSVSNRPPRVAEHDAALTPPEYLKTVEVTKPDRDKIKEALQMGAVVDGWHLTNGSRSLTIRTR